MVIPRLHYRRSDSRCIPSSLTKAAGSFPRAPLTSTGKPSPIAPGVAICTNLKPPRAGSARRGMYTSHEIRTPKSLQRRRSLMERGPAPRHGLHRATALPTSRLGRWTPFYYFGTWGTVPGRAARKVTKDRHGRVEIDCFRSESLFDTRPVSAIDVQAVRGKHRRCCGRFAISTGNTLKPRPAPADTGWARSPLDSAIAGSLPQPASGTRDHRSQRLQPDLGRHGDGLPRREPAPPRPSAARSGMTSTRSSATGRGAIQGAYQFARARIPATIRRLERGETSHRREPADHRKYQGSATGHAPRSPPTGNPTDTSSLLPDSIPRAESWSMTPTADPPAKERSPTIAKTWRRSGSPSAV